MRHHFSIEAVRELSDNSRNRIDFWGKITNLMEFRRIVEIGVYRAEFAAHILNNCDCINEYIMVDPWRRLPDWHKPANTSDARFESFYKEAMARTSFAKDKITVLRGRTIDVVAEIEDESIDFVYVDGDHSLRGIAIDLISAYPKVKLNGIIGGDDFTPNIWQHGITYEPTLVFPFATYFSEAKGMRLISARHNQFLMQKGDRPNYAFIDFTGRFSNTSVRSQLLDRAEHE